MSKVGVKVDADTRGFESGMNRATAQVEQFSNKMRTSFVGKSREALDQTRSLAMGWMAVGGMVGGAAFKLGEFISNVARGDKATTSMVKKWSAIAQAAVGFSGALEKIELAELNKENEAWLRATQKRVAAENESVKAKIDQLRLTEAEKDAARESEESLIAFLEEQKAKLGDINELKGNELAYNTQLLEQEKIDVKIKEAKLRIAERNAQAAKEARIETEKQAKEAKKAAEEEKKRQDTFAKSLQSEGQRAAGLMQGIEDEESRKRQAGLQFFRSGQGAVGGGRNVGLSAEQMQKQTEKQQQMQKELQKSNELLKQIAAAIREQKGGMLQ